jgi:hypothetical protein
MFRQVRHWARGLFALGGAQPADFSGRHGRRGRPDWVTTWPGSSVGRVAIARDIVAEDTTTPSAP